MELNLKQMKGLRHKNEDFDITIKWSQKARDKELIKFKVKNPKGEFEIGANDLLQLIHKNFKEHHLAAAIEMYDTNLIPVAEAMMHVHFQTLKEYKQGDWVDVNLPMQIPLFMANVMQAYKLVTISKDTVVEVPIEKYKEAAAKFYEVNEEFVKKYYQRDFDDLEKIQKQLNETAEVTTNEVKTEAETSK
jgi:hypothetical protein